MIKTVSKDLAIKLKACGFPQDTHFWYQDTGFGVERIFCAKAEPGFQNEDVYALPTAEEILELLPDGLFARRIKDKWYGCRYHDDVNILSVLAKADTMAECAGKLYLLKEDNHDR